MIQTALSFADLAGWADDDHRAALDVFLQTCAAVPGDWTDPGTDPRGFFESRFRPVMMTDGTPMLFTGYFEPELPGALQRGGRFQHPIYAPPPDLIPDGPWLSRRQIEETDALAGLEILWLASAVERFFLQVQGSGRIALPDGQTLRVGFAAKNGHPYASIGAELIRRGELTPERASAQALRDWIAAHPEQEQALLWTNPSYAFFRKINTIPATDGPIGSLGESITPLRSIAVDPAFTPLGLPVWIEMDNDLHRLMIAQDTGSAIRGAQRADIFYGTGDAAGDLAGRTKATGRMITLIPK